ncbi:16S rRNA (cytosine(967)-C(5))-methyltransferase RsmB [Fictibacillus phosphorivorans]|uniref:16S rRNA (cytosine(967)-C(5))-methyltransferase RsmB n=1 Tax=Fictibacillus phosphorivorans TaxID=1221500 RepID=UPI00203E2FD1|nr:16S rRNA (cytosine(967)-C(5))-methyltransferase RsmB [Fictibacillus phosphorivorans]MCM3717211.1 16S rRNA (cytosine(967)-C(5))-methyltransferase RsmB [Fictibacillus phosphorivorans]MCM3774898.1 16S rRNA (cytosine(967)-C(5))-methyltransferase RsmB [Fictibacillus phosphorivorans]
MENNIRAIALDVLIKIEQNQAYSNLQLNQALQDTHVKDIDKGLLTSIVYGTIQRKNTIDFYLDQLLNKPIKKKDRWVLSLLRLSIFQMLYMDRVPDHAIIHEAVEIAKQRGHQGLAGLVNGILRKLQREGTEEMDKKAGTGSKKAALTYSMPEWLFERWTAQFGHEDAERMAESNLLPSPVTARVNTMLTTRDEVLEQLKQEGVSAEEGELSPEGIIIKDGYLPETEVYRKGYVTIQDESSMLVARAVAPLPGETILDACAAPGGKSTHMAEMMNGSGKVVSLDLHAHKIKLINKQAERLGLANIEASVLDARKVGEHFDDASFDRVLVDAPCSGFGVIRKKPDLKWSKSEEDVLKLASIQKDILESASKMVKTEGILVYSTCTVDQEENTYLAEWFLENHPEFEWDPDFSEKMPANVKTFIIEGRSDLQIMPHYFNSDGFYIAAFRKTKTGGEKHA